MTEQEAINVFKGFKFTPREMKAVEMGIEALEKQIPKEPKCYEDKFIHCPSCGIGFGYKWECYPTKVNDYSHIQYCYGCGQMIDWGNEYDREE